MKKQLCWLFLLTPLLVSAQGTRTDYDRANGFREKFRGLVLNERVAPNWIGNSEKFWYLRQEPDGKSMFMLVDPLGSTKKKPAFDHQKLAAFLTTFTGKPVDPTKLPFSRIDFTSDLKKLRLKLDQKTIEVDLTTYEGKETQVDVAVNRLNALSPEEPPRGNRSAEESSIKFVNQSTEVLVVNWLNDGKPVEYRRIKVGEEWETNTFSGHSWLINRLNGDDLAIYVTDKKPGVAFLDGKRVPASPRRSRGTESPDGKWRIAYKNDNLVLVNAASKEEKSVTTNGTKANSYNGRVWWSPDSKHVAVYQSEPGDDHPLNIVVTTPKDQFQPRLMTQQYLKPGDKLPKPRIRIVDVETEKVTEVDDALYMNPFDLSGERWLNNDQFIFRYNQRGHQVMRLIGVNAKSGEAKAIINEEAKTFIDWNYKSVYEILPSGKQSVWMSERSGWCHLYLQNLETGTATPITKGDWVVRGVTQVDEFKKQIWFTASGLTAGEDPYHVHACRINFDGTGFTRLTGADGSHSIEFSPNKKVIFDTYSRADLAPTFEVRSADSGKKLVDVEQADISGLVKAGFKVPQRFVAKARDGVTDIYGLVYLPTTFDSTKKYPVVEDIYAGPHGSFVPKTFHTFAGGMSLAELGFIVVRIDGMGTSNRSKAFHDVCYKNIVDAGFPDRILWMKAAAQKWTQMDLDRVGIYGTSAGGQNALHAVLTQGSFYKAAVADCGCYDNRMDKMWWNEQWMGWPVGPHYEAQSGPVLAKNLTGKLLLMVGELDTNVDPASTYQVVDALQKADKDFEFVVVMNNGHGAIGNPYARRRFQDFFVRSLLGVEPRGN